MPGVFAPFTRLLAPLQVFDGCLPKRQRGRNGGSVALYSLPWYANLHMETEGEVSEVTALVDIEDEEEAPGVYELGYHLAPDTAEDAREAEAAALSALITENGGEVIGEQAPLLIPLAYPMKAEKGGGRSRFTEAHFGWVAFSVAGSALVPISEGVAERDAIFRHLIVKTTRDQVAANLLDSGLDVMAEEEPVHEVVGADAIDETKPAEPSEPSEKLEA